MNRNLICSLLILTSNPTSIMPNLNQSNRYLILMSLPQATNNPNLIILHHQDIMNLNPTTLLLHTMNLNPIIPHPHIMNPNLTTLHLPTMNLNLIIHHPLIMNLNLMLHPNLNMALPNPDMAHPNLDTAHLNLTSPKLLLCWPIDLMNLKKSNQSPSLLMKHTLDLIAGKCLILIDTMLIQKQAVL